MSRLSSKHARACMKKNSYISCVSASYNSMRYQQLVSAIFVLHPLFTRLIDSDDCLNGGRWNSRTLKCICSEGFTGTYCQLNQLVCDVNRCQHGLCVPASNSEYKCSCNDGYRGRFCELMCWSGTFGHNCTGVCGNCKNSNCHVIDGRCKEGCSKGWTGPQCHSEEVITKEYSDGFNNGFGFGSGAIFLLIFVIVGLVFLSRKCVEYKYINKPVAISPVKLFISKTSTDSPILHNTSGKTPSETHVHHTRSRMQEYVNNVEIEQPSYDDLIV